MIMMMVIGGMYGCLQRYQESGNLSMEMQQLTEQSWKFPNSSSIAEQNVEVDGDYYHIGSNTNGREISLMDGLMISSHYDSQLTSDEMTALARPGSMELVHIDLM